MKVKRFESLAFSIKGSERASSLGMQYRPPRPWSNENTSYLATVALNLHPTS